MNDFTKQLFPSLNAIWRRRWKVLLVAWLLCVAGWIFVAVLPNKYESSVRVYVDTDSILRPLLSGIAVESNMDRELEVMQRTLLSQPNLEEVIRVTDLGLEVNTAVEREELIRKLWLKIDVLSEKKNLFEIKYSHPSAETARQVVQSLLTIFVEANLGESRREMDDARRFIDEQINEYRGKLELAEERLANFKRSNIGLLPGQGGYYDQLQAARAKLENALGEYAEAGSRHQEIRRQLASEPKHYTLPAGPDGGAGSGPLLDEAIRMLELEKTIDGLLERYTEQHPEVVAARLRLNAIQNQLDESSYGSPGPVANSTPAMQQGDSVSRPGLVASDPVYEQINPVYEKIKVQLVTEGANVATLQMRVARYRTAVTDLEERARIVPGVEAELTKLTRDYSVLRINYEKLLDRREAAKISQQRELKGDKVQFRIIDPPKAPIVPIAPNRILFHTLVLLAGWGGAIAFGWLLASLNTAFSDTQSLKRAFGIPVLGAVSTYRSIGRQSVKAVEHCGLGMACLALLLVYGGLLAVETSVDADRLAWHKSVATSAQRVVTDFSQGLSETMKRVIQPPGKTSTEN